MQIFNPSKPQLTSVSGSFLRAAERCLEERQIANEKPEFLGVPAVVCLAFSIEVGFKTLLNLQGKSKRGHKLFKLYENLSPCVQKRLMFNTALPKEEFEKNLGLINTAFEDWRYIYEDIDRRSISIQFLIMLAHATQTVILEISALQK